MTSSSFTLVQLLEQYLDPFNLTIKKWLFIDGMYRWPLVPMVSSNGAPTVFRIWQIIFKLSKSIEGEKPRQKTMDFPDESNYRYVN